jgi:hypothetical protein
MRLGHFAHWASQPLHPALNPIASWRLCRPPCALFHLKAENEEAGPKAVDAAGRPAACGFRKASHGLALPLRGFAGLSCKPLAITHKPQGIMQKAQAEAARPSYLSTAIC